VLARQLRHDVRRDRRRIAERAVVVADQRFDQLERRRLEHELGVLGAERLCGGAREVGLVVARVLRKPDRERAHALAQQLGHHADDDRRVDTAREKRAERHVGLEATLDRGGHELSHCL